MESPETLLLRAFRSRALKRIVGALTLGGIIISAIALLPGTQGYLTSLLDAGMNHARMGANADHIRSLLTLPFTLLFALLFGFCCLCSRRIGVFMERPGNEKAIRFLCAGITGGALVFISLFSYLRGWQWLNSDHASEMILGKLLASENALMSRNWHYSTEIRMVYQTVFTMPLFKLLGGFNDWALIRAITILLNNALLIFSYRFCARRLGIPEKWVSFTAVFLLIPLSQEYWDIVTFGGYYTFLIVQMFFCVGWYAGMANHQGRVTKIIISFVLYTALSFALGTQGIRALMCVHIPLLITSVYSFLKNRKRIFTLFLGCYGFLLCGAGFAVNALLHLWYSFHSYDAMAFEGNPFRVMSKFGESLMEIAGFFGFSPEAPILSAQGVFGAGAIIIAAALLWNCFKTLRAMGSANGEPLEKMIDTPDARLLITFFISSAVMNCLIFILVSEDITGRYFIPFMVFYVPILALLFDHGERAYGYLKRAAILCGLTLFIAGQGYLNFQALRNVNLNEGRSGYIQYLLDHQLDYGFATFWNANVTSELTNGSVEIASLAPLGFTIGNTGALSLRAWLNKIAYFDPAYHEGESFLLLTSAEWETTRRSKGRLTQPDYRDNRFVVKRFDSAKTIHREILDP